MSQHTPPSVAVQLFSAFNKLAEQIRHQAAEERTVMSLDQRLGHEPDGWLTTVNLGVRAAAAYQALGQQIWAASLWGRRGNESQLVRLLDRFLVEVSDADEQRRDRVKRECIRALGLLVGGPTRRWKVIARVAAFLPGRYDIRLAGLRFRSMTEEQQDEVERLVRRRVKRPREDLGLVLFEMRQLAGRDVMCEADVEAGTHELAVEAARTLVEERLDCLAGVVALMRKPSDPENDPRRRKGARLTIDLERRLVTGGFGGMDAADVNLRFLVDDENTPAVRALLRLITKKVPTEGERRLLRALRWSGRSRRADNVVSAYLYAVIAFETLLGSRSKVGISYGLRLRCAQLIGTTRSARRRILHATDGMYDLRSNIVHSGVDSVDVHELVQLWALLNRVFLAYRARGFARRKDAEIETWFENQLL